MHLCYKNRQNRDLIQKKIFSKKITGKIGRFFEEKSGKNRESMGKNSLLKSLPV